MKQYTIKIVVTSPRTDEIERKFFVFLTAIMNYLVDYFPTIKIDPQKSGIFTDSDPDSMPEPIK